MYSDAIPLDTHCMAAGWPSGMWKFLTETSPMKILGYAHERTLFFLQISMPVSQHSLGLASGKRYYCGS